MKSKRWIDPRLIIGVVLVAISIASVAFVVTQSNRTIEVWVASDRVAAGETITASDVALARVQLDAQADLYHPHDDSPVGLVVTRSMMPGELIPRSAVVEEAFAESTKIVVPLGSNTATDLARGDVVDVWAAAPAEDRSTGFGEPGLLVDDAVVVAVHEQEGLLSTSGAVQVELLIPNAETEAVLDAISNKHALHLVPDPVPGG